MKVLTFADLHLRSTVPSCVDATSAEWMDIQQKALDKVVEIAVEHNVDSVYVGGDIFHTENTTSFKCITTFQNFAKTLYDKDIKTRVIFGNHDLKYHSSIYLNEGAAGIILNSNYIFDMKDSPIKGCNFDEDDYEGCYAMFKHILCIPSKDKPDFIDCETPESLLKKYYPATFIFTGDYHRNFVYENNGSFVINSGCLTKQASDFKDYETGVYVTDLNSHTVEWCPVNIEQKFVENGRKDVDKSIMTFVDNVKQQEVNLDFMTALKNKLLKQEECVQDKVNSWIERVGQ